MYAIEQPTPMIERLIPINKAFGESQYKMLPIMVMSNPMGRTLLKPNLSRNMPFGICKIAYARKYSADKLTTWGLEIEKVCSMYPDVADGVYLKKNR